MKPREYYQVYVSRLLVGLMAMAVPHLLFRAWLVPNYLSLAVYAGCGAVVYSLICAVGMFSRADRRYLLQSVSARRPPAREDRPESSEPPVGRTGTGVAGVPPIEEAEGRYPG
jgi:hypothetical protein